MKAEEFDKKFDNDEDITDHLDYSKARRPGREQKRVNVDFPVWMIQALDQEAERIGVPRQSVIKVWIAERLDLNPHPSQALVANRCRWLWLQGLRKQTPNICSGPVKFVTGWFPEAYLNHHERNMRVPGDPGNSTSRTDA